MASILKVDTIQDQSGNNIINENADTITIGKSGDTVNLAAGATNNLGITEADIWRLTANITSDTDPVSANLERDDNAGFSKIGTGMTLSSGRFSFPSTGLYKVSFTMNASAGSSDSINGIIKVTLDNSFYGIYALANCGDDGSGRGQTGSVSTFVNVTDTSNIKVSLSISSLTAGSTILGNTSYNRTFIEFIRLGDSQ